MEIIVTNGEWLAEIINDPEPLEIDEEYDPADVWCVAVYQRREGKWEWCDSCGGIIGLDWVADIVAEFTDQLRDALDALMAFRLEDK